MNSEYVHADEVASSMQAAEIIVPLILSIVGPTKTVVDVGGGTGAWLNVFRRHSCIDEVLLLDRREALAGLLIDEKFFRPTDLNEPLPAVRRFDLAVSVECAEHLRAESAEPLVDWLTQASDKVVFSAAVPEQGGKGHINERSPDYWQELFHLRGFVRRDVFRRAIAQDIRIPWWYRQNLFLFTRPATTLATTEPDLLPNDLQILHRDIVHRLSKPTFKRTLARLIPSFLEMVKHRLRC